MSGEREGGTRGGGRGREGGEEGTREGGKERGIAGERRETSSYLVPLQPEVGLHTTAGSETSDYE